MKLYANFKCPIKRTDLKADAEIVACASCRTGIPKGLLFAARTGKIAFSFLQLIQPVAECGNQNLFILLVCKRGIT